MSDSHRKLSRTGWRPAETDRLFALAEQAQANGRPLKGVFDEVAIGTGRRPNSVRNYYYARVKETGNQGYIHQRAFEPFTDEEAALLVEEVLSAQAKGESVRSCTLRLASGNDKAMLRYQNKYRSMLKNSEALVRRIFTDMQKCGKPTINPYAEPVGRRAGRPKKQIQESGQDYARVIRDLSRVEGLNVHALMDSLGALALGAIRATAGAKPMQMLPDAAEIPALRMENEALKNQLTRQHERYRVLLGYFTQLIRINSEFLSLNSVVKVSNLSSYIRDLENNVRNCEKLVLDGVR
ncbi:MAG: hypothetical protein RRZ24_03470 [Clostridia bacterium]